MYSVLPARTRNDVLLRNYLRNYLLSKRPLNIAYVVLRTDHKYAFSVKLETTSRDTPARSCLCACKGLTSGRYSDERADGPMKRLRGHHLSNSGALLGDWRDVRRPDIAPSDHVRPPERRNWSISHHGERWMATSTSGWLHEKVRLFSQRRPEQQHRQVQLYLNIRQLLCICWQTLPLSRKQRQRRFIVPVRKRVLTLFKLFLCCL